MHDTVQVVPDRDAVQPLGIDLSGSLPLPEELPKLRALPPVALGPLGAAMAATVVLLAAAWATVLLLASQSEVAAFTMEITPPVGATVLQFGVRVPELYFSSTVVMVSLQLAKDTVLFEATMQPGAVMAVPPVMVMPVEVLLTASMQPGIPGI